MTGINRVLRMSALCIVIASTVATAHALKIGSRDQTGNWIVEEFQPRPERLGGPGTEIFNGTNLTINVTYLDCVNNTGVGFDDAVRGATRRATFLAVFAYLDTVIGNVGTLDVECQPSVNLGGSTLAIAGTHYFLIPGFNPGFALQRLLTGVDPLGGENDIEVTVDFPTNNWNDDLGVPAPTEVDLFSVLLHEVTHGLGWISISDSVGASRLSPGVMGVYDDFIFTGGTNQDLFITGGVFTGNAADLTGADGGLRFNGPNAIAAFGSRPPLYAPPTFLLGTSIAHADLGILGGSVMEPAISSGVQKRSYTATDIGILEDLGYTRYIPPSPTPSPGPTVNGAQDWEIYA